MDKLLIHFLIVFCCSTVFSQQKSDFTCTTRPIAFFVPLPTPPFAVKELRVGLVNDSSMGRLAISNTSGRPLRPLLVLVTLLDSEGDYLFSLPFYNSRLGRRDRRVSDYGPWFDAHSSEADTEFIPSGGTYSYSVTGQAISSTCPAKAVVTAIHVAFSDSSEYDHSIQDWVIGPAITEAAHEFTLRDCPLKQPFALWLALQVDTEGHGRVIGPRDLNPEIRVWLEQQVNRWQFVPQIRAGTKLNSNLNLLLRVHEGGDWKTFMEVPHPTSEYSKTVIIIDAVPSDSARDNWLIFAGRTVASNHTLKKE